MKHNNRIALIIIAVLLVPVIVKLQQSIDPGRQQFQPGKGVASVVTEVGNNPVVLPSQFVAGTVIGFREVVAGLLWVRVNDFFHSGNYEVIVPLTRMITWLDPHQIDVYCTGAWHLAFNFVDSNQRADRRYLVPAIVFLKEGIENNPKVWDTKFDLGFVLYNMKAHDYDTAAYWIIEASKHKDAPHKVYRQVAHMLEKAGQIDKAIEQWERCVEEAEAALAKNPNDRNLRHHLDVSKMNLEQRLARKVMRADLDKNPKDIGFEATFERLGPRVFMIRGKANLPDFARIGVTLWDEDFQDVNIDLDKFHWQVDPDTTAVVDIGLHGIVVEDGRFERKFDLSRDLKQYPFANEDYVLTFSFNPRSASISVQDKVGWNGEGITDKNYLDTSVPGLRAIKKVIPLKREDIIGKRDA